MANADLPSAARRNVELVAAVERQLQGRRSPVERLGDAVAGFFGSFRFIAAHVAFVAAWVVLNSGLIPGVRPFDPYPFNFLGLLVGLEFILLTTFVLMTQGHQMRRTEQWSMLTLQMCLLAEQEGTKNLQLLQQLCRRLGVRTHAADEEVHDLARPTDVAAMVEEIDRTTREVRQPAPHGVDGPSGGVNEKRILPNQGDG